MRRIASILLLASMLFLLTACLTGSGGNGEIEPPVDYETRYSDYIFDTDNLSEIHLKFTLKDWNDLLSYYDISKTNERKVPVTFVYTKNGVTDRLDSVGIRVRGSYNRLRPEEGEPGSLHTPDSTDWNRAHFALEFSEYHKYQSFCHTDRLNLRCYRFDKDYIREVYCYDLLQRFGVWSTPRAAFTRLTIEVEGDSAPAYFGVYNVVESVNEGFLNERERMNLFKTEKGNLWKGYSFSFAVANPLVMGISEMTSDGSPTYYKMTLKSNKRDALGRAQKELCDFIKELNNTSDEDFEEWADDHVAVEQFLRSYAVVIAVGSWDDYWISLKNYYTYIDADDKFYFIPIDFDNTLGISMLIDNTGTQNPLRWGEMEDRPLILRFLENERYRKQFVGYLHELAAPETGLLTAERSIERITAWQDMIEPYIDNDTGENTTLTRDARPAGNCSFYRLLTGNDEGGANGTANFFKTKCTVFLSTPLE